ncbi:MAG: ABC transporter ATP-binding protein/permease [Cyanobacteria bacterium P01_G01_bin.39]
MFKGDLKLLKQFWQIAKPYWFSRSASQCKKLLLLLISLSVVSSIILVLETIQRGEIISSLAVRDGDRFWQTIISLCLIIVISVPLLSFKTYVESRLALNWRKWLTDKYLYQYLEQRRFYYLNTYSSIDNPDRTIAEDLDEFSRQSLFLFVQTLDGLIQLIAFVGIIWLIYKPLVLFLLIYSIVGTGILFLLFVRKLTIINFEQFKKEADFRFGLIRVRDSTESIAFYRGEKLEKEGVIKKLKLAIANFQRLIRWQFGLDLFQNGFQFLTMIIPAILLAPSIFAGTIEVGTITQSQIAFERIWLSLSLIIFQFEKITTLAAGVKRIIDLDNYLRSFLDTKTAPNNRISFVENRQFSLENLSLETPDSSNKVIENLSLQIVPQKNLLIVGNSGVGKTSLVRAIAGLWHSGTGVINKPRSKDILFLPQAPYLILGTLKQQLIYPNLLANIESEKLLETVDRVNLNKVIDKFGGLDALQDWSQVLSRGEQQRLAFARLLLYQPKYAVLDESTSALDSDNQDLLYQLLASTNITYISVGHRPNLLQYHQQVLQLKDNRTWHLFSAKEFNFA